MTIKLFGLLKELAGGKQDIEWSANRNDCSVKDLAREMRERYPLLGELIEKKKIVISVNQEIAGEHMPIRPGDEVALLPPFAGGADCMQVVEHESLLARVQRDNFSIDEEIDRVRKRSRMIGGITVFLGTAKERSRGRDVSRITFEHYEGMAQKKLREIRERALKRFDILEALIVHRYGDIEIGENIVLVIVGAEHRAEAFQACSWCIDELKQITPIWKCETTPDGQVWVEEHP